MKSVACLFALCLMAWPAHAQAPGTRSPEVHGDRKVTFRVHAPNAKTVSLFGDWMTPGAQQAMSRDDQGTWSVTVGPLEPTVSIYSFTVDGLTIADPVNPRMKLRARTSASLVEVPGDASTFWQAREVPHGLIEIHQHAAGSIDGLTREFRVYTPPGYHAKENAERRYPVLYLLHGSNDTAAGWTDVGRAHFILDNLIAEKRAVPMIVVLPFGHAVPFAAPREIGSTNTAVFEKYLLNDVAPIVEKHYRAAEGRENRAIVGLSMGGGQALHIGLSHLDRFSHVGAFSSAIPGDFETRFKALLENPTATNERLKLLWVGCGRQDGAFERSKRLADTLTARGVRHTWHPTDGLHVFAVWRNYLIEVAPLLFK